MRWVVVAALLVCASRVSAQEGPRVEFDSMAQLILSSAVQNNLFVIWCAREVEPSKPVPNTAVVGDFAEPEVDHEKEVMRCPPTHDIVVRTLMPNEECIILGYEKQVFRLRPERMRILACKSSLHILLKRSKETVSRVS